MSQIVNAILLIITDQYLAGLERCSSGLFLVNLNDVILLHLQGLGSLVIVNSPSVKQEPGHDGCSLYKLVLIGLT